MSTASPYRVERDQQRTVVTLLPGLNEVPWADIEKIGGEILQRLQELPTPSLLVDLCALNYMGSVQVALVVRMYKAVKQRGGTLVVANSDPMVQQVLNIAGLDKLWTMADSRDEGLRLLGRGGDSAGGGWQCGIGIAAVVVSLVGLTAFMTEASWLPAQTALMIELIAAAVGFVFALWAVLKGEGSRRAVGAGLLVGCVALMLASVYRGGIVSGAPPQVAAPADPPREATAPVTALSDGASADSRSTEIPNEPTPAVPTPVLPASIEVDLPKPANATQPDTP